MPHAVGTGMPGRAARVRCRRPAPPGGRRTRSARASRRALSSAHIRASRRRRPRRSTIRQPSPPGGRRGAGGCPTPMARPRSCSRSSRSVGRDRRWRPRRAGSTPPNRARCRAGSGSSTEPTARDASDARRRMPYSPPCPTTPTTSSHSRTSKPPGSASPAWSTARRCCRRRRPAPGRARRPASRPAGDRIYLKAEHLQKTGSFKARGMTNRILTLSPEARARGAITLVGRERRPGIRVGRTRGRRCGDRVDAGRSRPHRRSMPASGTARGSSSTARTSARRWPSWSASATPKASSSSTRSTTRRSSPATARSASSSSRTCPTSTSSSSGSAAAG